MMKGHVMDPILLILNCPFLSIVSTGNTNEDLELEDLSASDFSCFEGSLSSVSGCESDSDPGDSDPDSDPGDSDPDSDPGDADFRPEDVSESDSDDSFRRAESAAPRPSKKRGSRAIIQSPAPASPSSAQLPLSPPPSTPSATTPPPPDPSPVVDSDSALSPNAPALPPAEKPVPDLFTPFPKPTFDWKKLKNRKQFNAAKIATHSHPDTFPNFDLAKAHSLSNSKVTDKQHDCICIPLPRRLLKGVDANGEVLLWYLPHALTLDHHNDLYAHLKHFAHHFPPLHNGSGDARHEIDADDTKRQQLQNILGPHGTWHIGGCEMETATSGLTVNLHRDCNGKRLTVHKEQAMDGFLSGTPFQALLEVTGAVLQAINPKMHEKYVAAYAALPKFIKRFWDKYRLKNRPGKPWAVFFILIMDLLCNDHKDTRDSPDCMCGMVGIGEFEARVNRVVGKQRFNAVFAIHQTVFNQTWKTDKGKRCA
ncbi:hypothetical protein HDV00_003705 [Rhizophlyctis rosea]|nr:hypothetical protein HDV00_003705 [Rhizophlyctis rosea]